MKVFIPQSMRAHGRDNGPAIFLSLIKRWRIFCPDVLQHLSCTIYGFFQFYTRARLLIVSSDHGAVCKVEKFNLRELWADPGQLLLKTDRTTSVFNNICKIMPKFTKNDTLQRISVSLFSNNMIPSFKLSGLNFSKYRRASTVSYM